MPRNRYAFRKSIPDVSVRFPGFGSVGAESWDHAGDAPRITHIALASARAIQRAACIVGGIEPPANVHRAHALMIRIDALIPPGAGASTRIRSRTSQSPDCS